ncbi:MAG: uridine kinase [Gemmatimonadetes bacterium]|nr:uridine kinase [Gemmatimonadota bacterium]
MTRPLFIGVAGGSGSGKSTIAQRIATGLAPARVAMVDMDAYYRNRSDLTFEERKRENWDHPNALEMDLFLEQLGALARREAIPKPVYDYATHLRRAESERVEPADAVIVDGILLFTDERVRQRLDVKVFVDTEADERLIRRLDRDVAERGRPLREILDQYLATVRPMHLQFVEPSKRYADVIVPRGGENAVAVGMIVSLVRDRLGRGPGAAPHG